jgi:hypothetical protein
MKGQLAWYGTPGALDVLRDHLERIGNPRLLSRRAELLWDRLDAGAFEVRGEEQFPESPTWLRLGLTVARACRGGGLDQLLADYAAGRTGCREHMEATGLSFGEVLAELGTRGLRLPLHDPAKRWSEEQKALCDKIFGTLDKGGRP